MAYYPKSQIKTNLYTNGGEYVYKSTRENYQGYYYSVSKGKFYTGKNPNDGIPYELIVLNDTLDSIGNAGSQPVIPQLLSINEANSNQLITFVNDGASIPEFDTSNYPATPSPRFIPQYFKTKPTPEEFQAGKYNRYFCKKNNELIYLEISKDTYTQLVNNSPTIASDLYTPTSILWQDVPTLNYSAVISVEQNLKWYGFSQYFKGNFSS